MCCIKIINYQGNYCCATKHTHTLIVSESTWLFDNSVKNLCSTYKNVCQNFISLSLSLFRVKAFMIFDTLYWIVYTIWSIPYKMISITIGIFSFGCLQSAIRFQNLFVQGKNRTSNGNVSLEMNVKRMTKERKKKLLCKVVL